MSPTLLTLLYQSQLKVYCQLYNIIELLTSNAFWYCFCEKIPGCPDEHRVRDWCLVCMLVNHKKMDTIYLDETKKYPVKLANFATEIYEQLKQIADYDRIIIELWGSNFSYRGRDFGEGTQWEVFLDEIIEFRLKRICE